MKSKKNNRYVLSIVMAAALLAAAAMSFALSGGDGDPAKAEGPMEVVKKSVEQVMAIITDPELKKPEKAAERRSRLRALVNDLFDFNEISKRVLGRHWRKFSKEEFAEFQDLFAKMLENIYIAKIENYSGEKVVYENAREIGRGKYAVNTKIVKDNLEIPVTYRLKKVKDRWVGYDVIVEGVSLVKNYRSQFQQILKKKSPEELLAHMRQKVKAIEEPKSQKMEQG